MFKKIIVGFLVIVVFLSFDLPILAEGKSDLVEFRKNEVIELKKNRPKYVAGEVLVKFKSGQINLANPGIMSFFREYFTRMGKKLEKDEVIESGNVMVYKINDDRSVEEVVKELKKDSNVEIAEPNYYSYVSDLGTNDTDKNKLWGLDNFGQTITFDNGTTSVGTNGADIDIARAWNRNVGTSDVIVAVIDTGVAWNHPDLIDNMWDGTNCVDKDGNTITGGCLHGYNLVTGSTSPAPTENSVEGSHGTHVAGVIAATANNGKGVVGVGRKVKIMGLNCQTAGGLSSSCIISSIDFAIKNGAKVINGSYAGSTFSSLEYEAMDRFKTAGGIFVTVAGNNGTDNEGSHMYPSDYDLNNIISVAATDGNDALASFSNFGATSVDVGAPGVNIYSSVSYRKDYLGNFSDLTVDPDSSWTITDNSTKGKVLWSDSRSPYVDNSDYMNTSNTIDLSSISSNPVFFEFSSACDDAGTTNADSSAASDYMALEVSGNGTNFTEISRWNKLSITKRSTGSCGANFCGDSFSVGIGSSYLTSNFKYRFRWITDGSLNTNNGCYVYNPRIIDLPSNGDGAGYDFKDGTSMAAPFVAGLAGYLFSMNPSATSTQTRDIILNNGDSISALSGKTVTGKRINAYNSVIAMEALMPSPPGSTIPPSAPTAFNAVSGDSQVLLSWTGPSDAGSTLIRYQIGYKISEIGTTVNLWIDQNVDTTNLVVSGVQVTGLINGTSYDFRVTAVNQNGLGEFAYDYEVIPTADFSNLSVAITNAQVKYDSAVAGTAYGQYPVEALANLQDAINTAKSVKSDLTSNQNRIDLAVISLNNAVETFNGTRILPSNIGATNISDLITYGTFVTVPNVGTTSAATKITVSNTVTINIGSGDTSTVQLSNGTVISEGTSQPFDVTALSATTINKDSVSEIGSGFTKEAVLQWGIPNTTLTFSSPVTLNMYVGVNLEGRTLNILRSPNGTSGWTSDGIVSPTTCVVTNGYCQFSATKASYFTAASYSAPNTQSGSNNNNNNNGGGAPVCTDTPPIDDPDLFEMKTNKGSVRLFYTPASKATSYAILYGFKKGDERFGTFVNVTNGNKGIQSADIYQLNPKLTYYFKVAAINGCTNSNWSEWVSVKPNKKGNIYKYKIIIKNKIKTLVNLFNK